VIEDQGATSFRELARTTPGVTLGTGEGGNAFGDRIFIRGFEARNDVYIDGQRDPGVSSREIFAVEQVEIVKGPSAAYFGRGTTGGSVGLQSKKAQTGTDFVIGELTGGTSDMLRVTVDANYHLEALADPQPRRRLLPFPLRRDERLRPPVRRHHPPAVQGRSRQLLRRGRA
jgi:catecholate siderophore receptor